MNAPEVLQEYARLSEPRLRELLEAKGARLDGLPVDLRPAHALLTDYVLRGGKRLRGALVLLGHEAGGGNPLAALDASVGLELLHAYLLIHDDFMDRDDVRRGGPTVHAALAAGLGAHHANSVAVLLGSLCQAWAYELVLGAEVPPARALAAGRLVAHALQDVTVGQALDVVAPLGPPLDARGVAEVQRLKTGSYTFELPLQVGAALAGAPAQLHEALVAFARPLGIAFQIADDLLGTFGDPAVTGKSAGADLREGKRTVLVARALESASPEDAALLREGLGKAGAEEALRGALLRSGAVDAARAQALALRDEALRALEGVPGPVADDLRAIADYAVLRAV